MGGRYPGTEQTCCYDAEGREIPCAGSGQDAEFRHGETRLVERFEIRGEQILDRLTGLCWSRDANPATFPLTWAEALRFIRDLNAAGTLDADDWRLPNRRELRSLTSHQTRRPALPLDHPFRNLFQNWYWSSTTFAGSPAHAWYVHMEGGRMFYGGKDQAFMVWPVRGRGSGLLARTGQRRCFDAAGQTVGCSGTGQDGECRHGRAWPEPRFLLQGQGVLDRLTGLVWHRNADLGSAPATWQEALERLAALNRRASAPWRLPNINELESLCDCDVAFPAIPPTAPFDNLCDTYWSSTTSVYESDWAWALYLDKGAVGVGHKAERGFRVWPVRNA